MGTSRGSRILLALNWIPAALSVAMIAAESTSMMSSENTSHWLYPLWVRLFGPMSAAHWAELHHLIRKTGHFVGYGVVSATFLFAWLRTLARNGSGYGPIWRLAAAMAVACTLLTAIGDEYHQSFLPSRTSSPLDVCIDLAGALATQLLLFAAFRIARQRQPLPGPDNLQTCHPDPEHSEGEGPALSAISAPASSTNCRTNF